MHGLTLPTIRLRVTIRLQMVYQLRQTSRCSRHYGLDVIGTHLDVCASALAEVGKHAVAKLNLSATM